MRKSLLWVGAVLGCFAMGSVFAEDAPKPYVTDAEHAELIKLIDESQDRVMGLITGLTDEQWNFKQNPDRWSVGECVEHIARSEKAILEMAKQIISSPRDPEWFTRTDGKINVLRQVVPNRGPQGQGGVQAPAEIRPSENWDRAHAIREFYAAHGEVRAYVETMDRNIKDHTFQHPVPQIGWISAYDWLNLLSLHVVRHSKQMEEVQADPKYPKTAGGAPAE